MKEVKAAEIAGSQPFCWRYRLEDEALKASIRNSGILMPVIVQRRKKKLLVLDGHRRLAAARVLKLKTVPVLELARSFTGKEAFLFSLVSNWRQELSEMDRARAVALAVRTLRIKPEEVRDTVAPLLGIPSDQATVDLYLRADAMATPLKDLFDEKKVPFRSCASFLRFSADDQKLLSRHVIEKMKLTTSQVLQAAEWLADILKRDSKTLGEVLELPALRQILRHQEMDPRTRADRFFYAIRWVRFPDYTAYLEKFDKARSLILREAGEIRIEPPPGFEEKGIEIHARVKTPGDFDRILTKLSERRPELISLFDFML